MGLLAFTQYWNVHWHWKLTIDGATPEGLRNSSGVMLDGAGNGSAGSDYVTTLTRKNLAGSASRLPDVIHAKVKESLHRVYTVAPKGR